MQWNIDPAHSSANFKVRHLTISHVHGSFSGLSGSIETDDAGKPVSVKASIPVDTLNTGNGDRDGHLKSPDFFDVAQFPTIEFVSRNITAQGGDQYAIEGELTLHGVTKPVTLNTNVSPLVKDPMSGKPKAGAEATVTINRKDFGLTWNAPLETGGLLLGEDVIITIDIEGTQG